jgi:hypothetical protein
MVTVSAMSAAAMADHFKKGLILIPPMLYAFSKTALGKSGPGGAINAKFAGLDFRCQRFECQRIKVRNPDTRTLKPMKYKCLRQLRQQIVDTVLLSA